jgi:hypothetical protein
MVVPGLAHPKSASPSEVAEDNNRDMDSSRRIRNLMIRKETPTGTHHMGRGLALVLVVDDKCQDRVSIRNQNRLN